MSRGCENVTILIYFTLNYPLENSHPTSGQKNTDFHYILTVIGRQSQYKKTEPRMRLVPPSKLPIGGIKLIEKQIFYPCPFFKLADLWFSYAKLEAKWCIRWQFSPFKLSQFVQKCYQLILKDINSYQRLHKYLIVQFNSEFKAKFDL